MVIFLESRKSNTPVWGLAKNNDPMPMSQKAFTLKAERAKARRSFWCMNRGKTEGPASACQWDEEQKKERYKETSENVHPSSRNKLHHVSIQRKHVDQLLPNSIINVFIIHPNLHHIFSTWNVRSVLGISTKQRKLFLNQSLVKPSTYQSDQQFGKLIRPKR